jgi:hypothetical protein
MASSVEGLDKERHSDTLSDNSKPLDMEKATEDAPNAAISKVPDGASSEYPHGTRLTIIVISLMLSTFLIALDNVRN